MLLSTLRVSGDSQMKLVGQPLDKVITKEIELKKLPLECKKIKDMNGMKLEFVKQTGLKTWKEAQEQFPYHATEDHFREFAGKAFG